MAFGQLKNSAGEAKCLQALGKKRKDASGVELLELSLSKQREMGDRAGEAACLYDLGCAQDEQGDTDTAIEWLQVKKSNLPNGSKRNHCNFEWAAGLRRREEGARRRVRRRAVPGPPCPALHQAQGPPEGSPVFFQLLYFFLGTDPSL